MSQPAKLTRGGTLPALPPDTTINLALQGGGAHGAFTWGVLDRLLEEPSLRIGCVSGASAGAVNAVVLAAGMIDGGAAGAKRKLDAVWQAVLDAQVPDFIRDVARFSMTQIMSMFSPYEFNPMGFDPLRNLLNAHVDFDRVRAETPFEMLIAATSVMTGRARLFRRHELTVDMVLASACLPTLHHAVMVGGEAFWDGGFSANPDLVTLAGGGYADDTLIVLLNKLDAGELPTRARDISAQVNAITFNMPLERDAALIASIQEMGRWRLIGAPETTRAIHRHRFHLISSHVHTAPLPLKTKVEPDAETFAMLKAAGRQEASTWLMEHRDAVGKRSSVEMSKLSA